MQDLIWLVWFPQPNISEQQNPHLRLELAQVQPQREHRCVGGYVSLLERRETRYSPSLEPATPGILVSLPSLCFYLRTLCGLTSSTGLMGEVQLPLDFLRQARSREAICTLGFGPHRWLLACLFWLAWTVDYELPSNLVRLFTLMFILFS
jgi:hypothetical protein